jgi:3-oxoadipate enol-lactonase
VPAIEGEHQGTHYQLTGATTGSVLVLINSLGADLRMWDHVLPALERHSRVLRFDMPGHGRSHATPGPYEKWRATSLQQLGEKVLALLDHLRLERADMCGISLGGMVAMWISIHAPERVRRLVLANTAAHIGTRAGWEQRIAEVRASGMAEVARATAGRWFTPAYQEQHAAEMEFIRAMVAATDAESYAACCGALRDTDLRGGIAAIAAPCLVITGTHDGATPPSGGQALVAALRRSKYVELEAAHLTAWERPDEFAAAVTSFLAGEESHYG